MQLDKTVFEVRSWRNRRYRVPLLIGIVFLLAAGSAVADSFCIPQASGVPALSGPPQWWDASAGEPDYWPRLDDPRWRGAMARSFGTGASEHVSFRALRDGSSVYLSWYVKVDPNLEPFVDALRVAFSPGGGAPDQLMEIFPLPMQVPISGRQCLPPPLHSCEPVRADPGWRRAALLPGSQRHRVSPGCGWTYRDRLGPSICACL